MEISEMDETIRYFIRQALVIPPITCLFIMWGRLVIVEWQRASGKYAFWNQSRLRTGCMIIGGFLPALTGAMLAYDFGLSNDLSDIRYILGSYFIGMIYSWLIWRCLLRLFSKRIDALKRVT